MAALAWPAITAAAATSYVCTEPGRKPRYQDRVFSDCAGEQVEKNPDGSTRRVVRPPLTEEERMAAQQREREEAEQRHRDFVEQRRNRELLRQYPDEASHEAARRKALEEVRRLIAGTEARLKALAADRRQLANEEEFYPRRPLPASLRSQIDANEAGVQAQRDVLAGQQLEVERTNRKFDEELARLRQLWAARQVARP